MRKRDLQPGPRLHPLRLSPRSKGSPRSKPLLRGAHRLPRGLRVRKLAIHLEESVWEAVYAFLSQPAAERAPSTLQTHLTQKDAWALADTLRGAGAEVQVLDSTMPDIPQPHPFEGCRAMDFGKTVAAVILGVLAAQLILLPLALLLS